MLRVMSFTPSLLLIRTAGIFASLQTASRLLLATPSDPSSSSESVHAVGLGVCRRTSIPSPTQGLIDDYPVKCGIARNVWRIGEVEECAHAFVRG